MEELKNKGNFPGTFDAEDGFFIFSQILFVARLLNRPVLTILENIIFLVDELLVPDCLFLYCNISAFLRIFKSSVVCVEFV